MGNSIMISVPVNISLQSQHLLSNMRHDLIHLREVTLLEDQTPLNSLYSIKCTMEWKMWHIIFLEFSLC